MAECLSPKQAGVRSRLTGGAKTQTRSKIMGICRACGSRDVQETEPEEVCGLCNTVVSWQDVQGQFSSATVCKNCFNKSLDKVYLQLVINGKEFLIPIKEFPLSRGDEKYVGLDIEIADWIIYDLG